MRIDKDKSIAAELRRLRFVWFTGELSVSALSPVAKKSTGTDPP